MGVVVQIAAHGHEARARRKGKVAAHRRTRHVGMEFGELRAVHKGHAPFLLEMRAAVEHVVGVGVRVPAEPEIDRARARRQILLEDLAPSGAPSGPWYRPLRKVPSGLRLTPS